MLVSQVMLSCAATFLQYRRDTDWAVVGVGLHANHDLPYTLPDMAVKCATGIRAPMLGRSLADTNDTAVVFCPQG